MWKRNHSRKMLEMVAMAIIAEAAAVVVAAGLAVAVPAHAAVLVVWGGW